MRALSTITLVSMIMGISLPCVAQPLNLPPASAPKVEQVKHTANGVTRRSGPAKYRKRTHAIRRHSDDLCNIVNGWRAFPLRGSYGYFNTNRVPCCRC